MKCQNCSSINIKSKKSYSHGTKSRGTTIKQCKDCGSSDIVQEPFKKKFQKRRN